jgi:hypothetical protein
MIIAASSRSLTNRHDCLDSFGFCLFRYRVFNVWSYILLLLWRNGIHLLALFFDIIFMIEYLSFRVKRGEYFTFVFSSLIESTLVIIVIEYQIIRVLSWFIIIFHFLKIKLTFQLVDILILIVEIIVVISILKIFNYTILIIILDCVDIWCQL